MVYGAGLNTHGQLGLGNTRDMLKASPMVCLRGSPIVQIACGAYHSLVISKSGFVICIETIISKTFTHIIFLSVFRRFSTVFACGLNA